MANTATIKVLVDDAALENLSKRAASTAKLIRGGFDIATGAAAVFGEQSAEAIEKLANRSIILANTFNGIEDLLDGLKDNDAFLKMGQKVGITRQTVEGLASSLPLVGAAVIALTAVFGYFADQAEKDLKRVEGNLKGVAVSLNDSSEILVLQIRQQLDALGDLDTPAKIQKAIDITKKGAADLKAQRLLDLKNLEIAYGAQFAYFDTQTKKREQDLLETTQRIEYLEARGVARTYAETQELERKKRLVVALKGVVEVDREIAKLGNEATQLEKKKGELIDRNLKNQQDQNARNKQLADQAREAERAAIEVQIEAAATKEKAQAMGLKNEVERSDELFKVEETRLKNLIDLNKAYGKDTTALEAQLFAARLTEAKRLKDERLKLDDEERQKSIEADKRYFNGMIESERLSRQQQLDLTEEYFLNGTLSEEEYLKAKKEINDKFDKDEEQRREKKKKLDEQAFKDQIELINQAIATATEFANLSQELSNQRLAQIQKEKEARIQSLEDAQALELGIYAESEKDKAIIDEKYRVQKLAAEEEFAKQEKQIRKRQADVQLAITTAQTIANVAAASAEASAKPLLFALVIAAGAAAIATAIAQRNEVAKLARGGMLVGPSHANGGIYMGGGVEAEGGEAVINKRSSRMFGGLLSAVNQAGGGVPIMPGESIKGGINTTSATIIDYDALASAMARNPVKAFVVTQDITLAQDKQTAIQSKATIA